MPAYTEEGNKYHVNAIWKGETHWLAIIRDQWLTLHLLVNHQGLPKDMDEKIRRKGSMGTAWP